MNDEQTRTRFETLLLPLMNAAHNLTRWLMKNQEDAEDIVQELYLKAFRFFASFHQGTNCRAWFLVLFGAKKLPDLARSLGQSMNEFRKAREDIDRELHK